MQVAFLLFKGMQLSNAESQICKCVRKKKKKMDNILGSETALLFPPYNFSLSQ